MEVPVRCRFGTKAQTLAALEPLLRSGIVLPQFFFTVATWQADPVAVLNEFGGLDWSCLPLMVRSSVQHEDADFGAHAGQYRSIQVNAGRSLSAAIQEVVASYGENPQGSDEVLVQPLLQDALMSGVVVTSEPATGAPYFVVNYSVGKDTTAVTSGSAKEQEPSVPVSQPSSAHLPRMAPKTSCAPVSGCQ